MHGIGFYLKGLILCCLVQQALSKLLFDHSLGVDYLISEGEGEGRFYQCKDLIPPLINKANIFPIEMQISNKIEIIEHYFPLG